MAKAPAKKSAKTSGAKKAAAPARKPARPRAKKITFPEPGEVSEEAGTGAAAVAAPVLHEPAEPEAPTQQDAGTPDEPEEAPAPTPEGAHWAEQVAAARSRPLHVEDDSGTVQVAPAAQQHQDDSVPLVTMEAEEEAPQQRRSAPAVAPAGGGVGIPEQFLTIAIPGQWDDRMERVKRGRMGAALAGSLLLELAVHGKLRVQRDHFVVEEDPTGDADLDHFAEQVQELGPVPTEQAIRRLGRRLTDRIRPWKARAEGRGWLREDRRKFLGLFPRSTTTVLDEEVQAKLQNRLVRMLAGGGNPDVQSIALLGLIQSAGLLGQMVPSSALAFNERRISLLLSGRDPLHYRVDTSVRQVQDLCLRTILADVRRLR